MAINLSEQAEQRVAELKQRYPDAKSVVMPALFIAQEELGCVNDRAILWAAEKSGVAPVHVRELATFYSMYQSAPVGRYHFQVCGTLSCALSGSSALLEYLARRFGIPPGQPSTDGMWSYAQVECLGACGDGPVVQINDTYFERVSVERLEGLIAEIEKRRPDLSLSSINQRLGKGLQKANED